MTRENKELLRSIRVILQENLILDSDLTGELLQERIISKADKQDIDACPTQMKKAGMFLDKLDSKADSAFYALREIFYKRRRDNPIYEVLAEKLGYVGLR